LSYIPGVNSYSNENLSVEVKPVVPPGATSLIKTQIDNQGDIPVEVEPEYPESDEPVDVPVVPALDQASVQETANQIAAAAAEFAKTLVIPVTLATSGVASADGAASDTPGFASGDMVRGPGTGTSDSILARLSNGEFVVKAAAVRHYGPELLRQINSRRFPAFASGGLVSDSPIPSVSSPPQSLLDLALPQQQKSLGSFTLNMGGETYQLQAPEQDFQRLIRNQRIKFGRS